MDLPPKPASRPDDAGWLTRIRLFRQDMFRSQPARLYRAWMAEMPTPFYRSYLVNDPDLVREVLDAPEATFPKHPAVGRTLRALLGRSVFVSGGQDWARARRIIDPAFEGGRLRAAFDPVHAAGEAAVAGLLAGPLEAEAFCSRLAADAMFRLLFSTPISEGVAAKTYEAFRGYQRAQPLLRPLDLVRAPDWIPRLPRREDADAARIRALLTRLVDARIAVVEAGTAPDDLATRLLTKADPETGRRFDREEMVDQVSIFFLAGHETSAAALSWALYLLATHPEAQERARVEAQTFAREPAFAALKSLPFLRDVFRETLRLYPPVPMLVRENRVARIWRGRRIARGAMVILSPWHLHRHSRIWAEPDRFDPDRWSAEPPRQAYFPFSQGHRVCPGAGLAMMEGVLFLAQILAQFELKARDVPVPTAHLTVRSESGINLTLIPRQTVPDL
ncbi:MAG: cytochrome P450 [Pseudomonadota bacterium]